MDRIEQNVPGRHRRPALLVALVAGMALAGCGGDDDPAGPGNGGGVADTGRVRVIERTSSMTAAGNGFTVGEGGDTYDSDSYLFESMSRSEATITIDGSWTSSSGSTASGSGSVTHLSTFTTAGDADLVSALDAGGTIVGDVAANSSVSMGIQSFINASSMIEVTFSAEDGPVEISIKGAFVLSDDDSYGYVELEGQTGGTLLSEEYDEGMPDLAFDHRIALDEGETYELRLGVTASLSATAPEGGSAAENGGASFTAQVGFHTPGTGVR